METVLAAVQPITSPRERRDAIEYTLDSLPAKLVDLSEEITLASARLYRSLDTEDRCIAVTGWDDQDRTAELSLELSLGITALSGKSVLLIDADFKCPQIQRILNTSGAPGLQEFLVGGAGASEVIRPAKERQFYFMPAGGIAPYQPGKLSIPDWKRAVAQLRNFDLIVVHAGPLVGSADAAVMVSECDTAVFGLGSGIRRREEVEELQRNLAACRTKLAGAVLTR